MPSRDEMLRSELTGETERDLQTLRALLHIPENRDAVERRHRCADVGFTLVYREGMAGDAKISEFILHASKSPAASGIADPVGWLKEESLEVAQCERESRVKELLTGILGGMTCVLADGCAEALLLDTRGFEHRRVDRPSNEAVVLGAQEGFVESLRDNLTLLHRYVQSGELITERLTVGTGVPTSVALPCGFGAAGAEKVSFPPMAFAALGLVAGVFSQAGDLTASLVKRRFGVKDYGTIFPGHGGMMDRFDGILFCAAAVWMFFHLFRF